MADDYDLPKGELMRGKKGLVLGVANHNSIAWGIAAQLAAQGAELAFGYMEANEKRARPLGESIGVKVFSTFNATDDVSIAAVFEDVERAFGTIDFLVHAVAFANREELKGSFVENTTRESFLQAIDVSVFSFVTCAKHAARLMPNAGSLLTLT